MFGSSSPPDLRVQTSSVLDVAEIRLREAILLGQLPPGQRLFEGELAAKMGISRPSLREAMRRLEAQQLVVLVPNRGSFVAELTEADIEEIRQVWRLLTGEAVYRLASRATKSDVSKMAEALTEAAAAARRGDALRLLSSTNAYFCVVLVGSANRTLANFIRIIVSRINFLRAQSLSDLNRCNQHVTELGVVLDLVSKRKATEARRAIEQHIDSACDGALAMSRRDLVA
jgi:GntR family transcriptional regulator, trigonelline degradation regulator